MDPAFWAFVAGLAGACIGAAASIFTTLITARSTQHLQHAAAEFERNNVAKEFQRLNLLQLQEALLDEMRLVTRAYLEDSAAFANSPGLNQMNLLSEELNQELLVASGKVVIFVQRVADDELRADSNRLRGMVTDLLLSSPALESGEKMARLAKAHLALMEKVGEVLRQTY